MKLFEIKSAHHSTSIVYVDMDGVLADFYGTIATVHTVTSWREIHRQNIPIDQIAQKPDFYRDLPPLPHAKHLIESIVKMAGKYSILSSPLMSKVEQSSEEKSEWLHHNLKHDPPQSIVFDHNKSKYAKQADGTPNILIDDYKTNIRLWNLAGGIGILYDDSKCNKILHQLKLALSDHLLVDKPKLAVFDGDTDDYEINNIGEILTNKEMLAYINKIHKDYYLTDPIMEHKAWILKKYPLDKLNTPEYAHQDDPYRRVIDINWDHVSTITLDDLYQKPIVVDSEGWVLDGNHRVTAAKARHLSTILAWTPYQ